MTPSGPTTAPALEELLRDGTLAGDWTLDGAQSTIGLKSKSMWGMAPVKGVFRQVTGAGTVSPSGEVSGTIVVSAASIDTKSGKRDKHLLSADFFDTGSYSDITFTVDGIQAGSDGVTVTGSLTVRDLTRPVSFPAAVAVSDSGITLDGQVTINRADFGLTWNQLGMASMTNTITVHAVFTRS
jgi:polyisoprenoid-binding protein YceI